MLCNPAVIRHSAALADDGLGKRLTLDGHRLIIGVVEVGIGIRQLA